MKGKARRGCIYTCSKPDQKRRVLVSDAGKSALVRLQLQNANLICSRKSKHQFKLRELLSLKNNAIMPPSTIASTTSVRLAASAITTVDRTRIIGRAQHLNLSYRLFSLTKAKQSKIGRLPLSVPPGVTVELLQRKENNTRKGTATTSAEFSRVVEVRGPLGFSTWRMAL